MIFGIGTDVVQIERIEKIYTKFGERFVSKNYHPTEIAEFRKLNHERRILFLAKRFCAKESIAKAFGTGIGKIGFKNIAITNNVLGQPQVKIFSNFIKDLEKYSIHISISDDYPIAVSFVIIVFLN